MQEIIKLRIRNLLGLKALDYDGGDIEVTGNNATGKSSFIDCVRFVLTNKSTRDYILKDGESAGEVYIETNEGLTIDRKRRTNKSDYNLVKKGKDKITEGALREIFTELQLNPNEFLSMDKNEQNRIILDLIDFEWSLNWIKEQFGEIVPEVNYEQNILGVLHEIQADEGYYFMKRQDINRDIRDNKACIEEIGRILPKDYNSDKWEDINLGELYRKIEALTTANKDVETARIMLDGKDEALKALDNEVAVEVSEIKEQFQALKDEKLADIEELKGKIEQLKDEISTVESKIHEIDSEKESKIRDARSKAENKKVEFEAGLKQYEEPAKEEIVDLGNLQERAETTEEMKAHVNEYKRMKGLQASNVVFATKSEELTEKIEKARVLPGEILEKSNIPIKGLSIKDGIPLINGLPISNLSDGEKFDLCIDVATQNESALNILLLDGVEKWSEANRLSRYKKLKDKGVRFIASRTTSDKELTVVEL